MKTVYTEMKRILFFLFAGGLCCASTSCSSDSPEEPAATLKNASVVTSAYDQWHYFSFEKGWMEEPADYRNNLSWDLAFHRWDVRTNGGTSGIGQGGVCRLPYLELLPDTWSVSIPAAAYTADGTIKTYMSIPNMNTESDVDQRVDVSANTVLGSWLTVTMTSIPPTYTLDRHVFLIRTAQGRYAAIQFLNYMNDKAVKGTVSFAYLYPLP